MIATTTDQEIYCETALTPDGWTGPAQITIDGNGYIKQVSAVENKVSANQLRGPVLPGMPNLHSHAFQRQMAGLTETGGGFADCFWTWREAMYRLADRITPDHMRDIAAWLQIEMLEAGYTSCGEFHYIHHQPGGEPYEDLAEMSNALIQAAESSGIAMTLLPVLYCRGGFSDKGVSQRQKRFFNTPERYVQLVDTCERLISASTLHRIGIAPHSLRAVSPEQLREVTNHLASRCLPVHIHIAEQPGEVDECLSVLGDRPVNWLLRHFPVDEHWCLVHATHMQESELRRAAASGAVAGLCPTTEADLGDGLFPAESWIKSAGCFGIGSDSNLRVSVAEELRLLEFGCRLRKISRNVLADEGKSCGRSLYERAVEGGAKALGNNTGRIEAGCRADLVELDSEHPLLEERGDDAIIDTWLFAGGSDMVRSVWVGGELKVEQGQHLRRTQPEKSFRQVMKDLA